MPHRPPDPAFLRPRPGILGAVLATLALALPTATLAQSVPLERLAPIETVVALGLSGDADLAATLDADLLDALADLDADGEAAAAWETVTTFLEDLSAAGALDLDAAGMDAADLDALGALGGLGATVPGTDALPDLGGTADAIEATCPGLAAAGDALTMQAWADDLLLAVAADRFTPIPGALALARVEADAAATAADLHERLIGCYGGDVLGEVNGAELRVLFDGSDLPLVVARDGRHYLVGTRPDLVRGALRRLGGADEPSLADQPVGDLLEGGPGARLAWNAAGLAGVVEGLVPAGLGPDADAARERAVTLLRTLGAGGARLDVDAGGATIRGVFTPDPDGGDPTFYDLATCAGCALDEDVALPGGVAAQVSTLRPAAWLDWLDAVARDLTAATGTPVSVRDLVELQAGFDVDALFGDWIAGELQRVRLGSPADDLDALVFGAPTVWRIPATDEAGARAALDALEAGIERLNAPGNVGGQLLGEALGDPLADAVPLLAARRTDVAGLPGLRVRVGPSTDVAFVVHDGAAWIAAPTAALGRALEAGGTATDTPGIAALPAPAGERIGWRAADPRPDLAATADLLDTVAQPLAFGASTALASALEEARTTPETPSELGFGEPGAPTDLRDVVPMAAPPGVLEAPRDVLPTDAPVEARRGDGEVVLGGGASVDLYALPDLPAGTEASVELTSDAFDTYLYLYDGATGNLLLENDDAPDTRRSAVDFVADGRPLIVGVGAFFDSGSGPYTLALDVTTAGAGAAPEPDAGADRPAALPDVAPDLAVLLPLAEFLPDAVRLLEERADVGGGVVSRDDGTIRHERRIAFDW